MKKINCDIRDKYARYQEVLGKRKMLSNSIIIISEAKGENKSILRKRELVTYDTQSDKAHIDVEVQTSNHKHFLFKLSAQELTNAPIFRFDSYGPRHRNSHLQVSLSEQNVDTPHFHRFTKMGYVEAYKTEQLKNEAAAKVLEDISLCVAHFCHESNTRIENDDFPAIKFDNSDKLFDVTDEDMLNNISFA